MLIRPTVAGLWFTATQFLAITPPRQWSAAEVIEVSAVQVLPLTCGQWVDLRAYSEPADRMWPVREIVVVRGYFKPSDLNFDGRAGREDWLAWLAGRYDFDQDGAVTILDDQAVLHWLAACP